MRYRRNTDENLRNLEQIAKTTGDIFDIIRWSSARTRAGQPPRLAAISHQYVELMATINRQFSETFLETLEEFFQEYDDVVTNISWAVSYYNGRPTVAPSFKIGIPKPLRAGLDLGGLDELDLTDLNRIEIPYNGSRASGLVNRITNTKNPTRRELYQHFLNAIFSLRQMGKDLIPLIFAFEEWIAKQGSKEIYYDRWTIHRNLWLVAEASGLRILTGSVSGGRPAIHEGRVIAAFPY